MDDSLTCTCGHRFTVTDAESDRRVRCPACGDFVERPETTPREFVTLWTSESQARARMNLEALSHFVAAVTRVVRRQVGRQPVDGELDIACALLPNGRLMFDVQLQGSPAPTTWVPSLTEQLKALECPPVRGLPVAFSYRTNLGESHVKPNAGFRIPFARWADSWTGESLDALILNAARHVGLMVDEAPTQLRLISPPDVSPENLIAPAGTPKSGWERASAWLSRWWRGALDRIARTFHRDGDAVEPSADPSGESTTKPDGKQRADSAPSAGPPSSSRTTPHDESDDDLASMDADDFSIANLAICMLDRPHEPRFYKWRAELLIRDERYDEALADYDQYLKMVPDDLETLVERGSTYCVVGNTRAGLADFNAALEVDPENLSALYHRGVLLMDINAFDAAVQDFSKALEVDPWSPRLHVSRGRAHGMLRQYEQAWDDFTAAIRLDPHSVEPYMLRGATSRFVRPFPDCVAPAIEDFTRAIEIQGDQAMLYVQRAEQYWVRDSIDEAEADCNRALELEDNLAPAYGLRGAIHLGRDAFPKAIDDCTRAIDLGLDVATVFLCRSEALQAVERFDEALQDAERAIELTPESAAAWNCRAMIHARLSHPEDALRDLAESLRLDADQPGALCHRAALQRHFRRTRLAVKDCDRALELAYDFIPAYLIRAACWEELGDPARAVADLDKLITLAPDEAHPLLERANFWMRREEFERARYDFDAVLERNPESVSARFHRGQVLAALNELPAALADLNEAIRLNPESGSLYARRANVWLQLNESERAEDDYARAVTLDPDSAEQVHVMQAIDEAHWRVQRGEYDEAIRAANEACERAPNHAPSLHVRALVLAESEQFVEALAEFDHLCRDFEESSAVRVGRAQMLAELGDYEAACQEFDNVLDSAGDVGSDSLRAAAYRGRALVLAGLGRLEESERDFAESIRLSPACGALYFDQTRAYQAAGEIEKAVWCCRLALQVSGPPLSGRRRDRARAFLKRYATSEEAN